MSKTPPLQTVMIGGALVLLALCIVLYFFAPAAKEGSLFQVILALLGFLFGKWTNGFGGSSKTGEKEPEK